MESPAHLDWLRLVGAIDSWAQSAVPSDGDIAVTLADERTVTVVLTPDDLDDLYVVFGAFSDIRNYVIQCLASVPAECDFLVYDGSYDLEPHTARELPPEPEMPSFTGGKWYAYDPRTGRETPFEDPDEDSVH